MSPGKSGVIYNPESSAEEFQKLASLCSDQSLLGNRLLEAAVTVGNANSPPTVSCAKKTYRRDLAKFYSRIFFSFTALTTEVELMILSHDCHTIACNMEGISAVLRLSRKRTSAIASAGQYKLMIRLLDGIGRYREMSYVLDQLRRAHKFELLLSKRSFKVTVAFLCGKRIKTFFSKKSLNELFWNICGVPKIGRIRNWSLIIFRCLE